MRTSFQKIICLPLVLAFSVLSVVPPQFANAQVSFSTSPILTSPGTRLPLSPVFQPVLLEGLKVNLQNPLQFEFIIDQGDETFDIGELKKSSQRLVKYFLASLTVPEDETWVNLSPYEKDRMIPDGFGQTEMGRDMLAQDYLLKQLTASLLYPEDDLGQRFWTRVYQKAHQLFGTTEIPVDTFNKVWIVPETATVYEQGQTAYVVEARMKVMLEIDYLALSQHSSKEHLSNQDVHRTKEGQEEFANQFIREIIIPEIEREVNEGKNFTHLRQMYHAMVLATWYKQRLRDSLLGRVYVDQNLTEGVDTADQKEKERIYQRYLQAFREGAFNYIKEDVDPVTQQVIPRKYFSGGFDRKPMTKVFRVIHNGTSSPLQSRILDETNKFKAQVLLTESIDEMRLVSEQVSSPVSDDFKDVNPERVREILRDYLPRFIEDDLKELNREIDEVRKHFHSQLTDAVSQWAEGPQTFERLSYQFSIKNVGSLRESLIKLRTLYSQRAVVEGRRSEYLTLHALDTSTCGMCTEIDPVLNSLLGMGFRLRVRDFDYKQMGIQGIGGFHKVLIVNDSFVVDLTLDQFQLRDSENRFVFRVEEYESILKGHIESLKSQVRQSIERGKQSFDRKRALKFQEWTKRALAFRVSSQVNDSDFNAGQMEELRSKLSLSMEDVFKRLFSVEGVVFPGTAAQQREAKSEGKIKSAVERWYQDHEREIHELKRWLPDPQEHEAYARHLIFRDEQRDISLFIHKFPPGGQTPVHFHGDKFVVVSVLDPGIHQERFELVSEGDDSRLVTTEDDPGIGEFGVITSGSGPHRMSMPEEGGALFEIYFGSFDKIKLLLPVDEKQHLFNLVEVPTGYITVKEELLKEYRVLADVIMATFSQHQSLPQKIIARNNMDLYLSSQTEFIGDEVRSHEIRQFRRYMEAATRELPAEDQNAAGRALEELLVRPELRTMTLRRVEEIVYEFIKRMTGNDTPYADHKKAAYAVAPIVLEDISKRLDGLSVKERLKEAFLLALRGNRVGSTRFHEAADEGPQAMSRVALDLMDAPIEFYRDMDDRESLVAELMEAGERKNVFYALDNVIEDIYDLSPLREILLLGHRVTLVAKSAEADNDTTFDDLMLLFDDVKVLDFIGDDNMKRLNIIPGGSKTRGTDPLRVTDELIKAWEEADVVILKGEGNRGTMVTPAGLTKPVYSFMNVKMSFEGSGYPVGTSVIERIPAAASPVARNKSLTTEDRLTLEMRRNLEQIERHYQDLFKDPEREFTYPIFKDVRSTSVGHFQESNLQDVARILDAVGLDSSMTFADAGGGDARVAAVAATVFGAEAYSIEGDSAVHDFAKEAVALGREVIETGKLHLVRQLIEDFDFRDVDVVYYTYNEEPLDLKDWDNDNFEIKDDGNFRTTEKVLAEQLKPGAIVIVTWGKEEWEFNKDNFERLDIPLSSLNDRSHLLPRVYRKRKDGSSPVVQSNKTFTTYDRFQGHYIEERILGRLAGWVLMFDVDHVKNNGLHSDNQRLGDQMLKEMNRILQEEFASPGAQFVETERVNRRPSKEEGFIYFPRRIGRIEMEAKLKRVLDLVSDESGLTISVSALNADDVEPFSQIHLGEANRRQYSFESTNIHNKFQLETFALKDGLTILLEEVKRRGGNQFILFENSRYSQAAGSSPVDQSRALVRYILAELTLRALQSPDPDQFMQKWTYRQVAIYVKNDIERLKEMIRDTEARASIQANAGFAPLADEEVVMNFSRNRTRLSSMIAKQLTMKDFNLPEAVHQIISRNREGQSKTELLQRMSRNIFEMEVSGIDLDGKSSSPLSFRDGLLIISLAAAVNWILTDSEPPIEETAQIRQDRVFEIADRLYQLQGVTDPMMPQERERTKQFLLYVLTNSDHDTDLRLQAADLLIKHVGYSKIAEIHLRKILADQFMFDFHLRARGLLEDLIAAKPVPEYRNIEQNGDLKRGRERPSRTRDRYSAIGQQDALAKNQGYMDQPAASAISEQDTNVKGGIDFNARYLGLQIKRDDSGVPLPLPLQPLGSLNIKGFYPVIINITPVQNLPVFLGLEGQGSGQDQSPYAARAIDPLAKLD